MDSNDNVMGRRSSSSSLPSPMGSPSPSSDYSSSSLGSQYDRSDLATPLKTTKDNPASVFIDSGYAGEQPSSGGDRSIPFSKCKFSSRVDRFGRPRSYEAPWTVHVETDGISRVFGFLNKKGLLPWVVTMLVLASTCFSLLFLDRRTSMYCSSSYSNGKYKAIKFGAEQLVKRLQQEGRLLIEVRDDFGNRLGGKKAAMQFVHESIYGKTKLGTLKEGSDGEDGGEIEKKNNFDELWKLAEELKTLEATLETLQAKEISPGNARRVQVGKADDGENEKNKEKVIDINQSEHVADKTETANDASGEVESDSGVKLEVEKKLRSRRIAVDETGSLPRSRGRLTEKGMSMSMRGRRKALAGLREEI